MSDEAPLKSAFELAMERLQQADADAGIEQQELSDAQKERIAEIRAKGKADLAELEIMRSQRIAEAAGDPVKLQEVEEHLEIDKKRIEARIESDVRAVKAG